MIRRGLSLLSQEQQQQLTVVRAELVEAGRQFETQNTEFQSLQQAYASQIEQKQAAMLEHLAAAEKQKQEIGSNLTAEFAAKQAQIDNVVAEIAQKQSEMETIRAAIDVVLARAQTGLQRQGEEAKREAGILVDKLRVDVSTEVHTVKKEIVDLSGKMAAIAQIIESGSGNIGSGSDGGMKFLKK